VTRSRGFWSGFYRLADPKITLASVASLTLATGLALHESSGLPWGWLAFAVFGIFWLEVAKNASGEVFDWDSGDDAAVAPEDRSPFSGGKRVLVDGLMSRREVWLVAALGYGLGIASGLLIAVFHEMRVLGVGAAGVALAFGYHAPPLKLSYRGLGEIAVGVTYGPLICSGAYLLLRGSLPIAVVASALPLGALVAAFLWINEFPDRRADEGAGKRTWVVRLGPERASLAFGVLVGVAYAGVMVLPLTGAPWGVLGGLLGLPPGIEAARRLLAAPGETARIIPAQALTLLSFVLMAAGAAAGVSLIR
jgi:1,4-dihydroxy-2-naphthoate octaprenyltransferase